MFTALCIVEGDSHIGSSVFFVVIFVHLRAFKMLHTTERRLCYVWMRPTIIYQTSHFPICQHIVSSIVLLPAVWAFAFKRQIMGNITKWTCLKKPSSYWCLTHSHLYTHTHRDTNLTKEGTSGYCALKIRSCLQIYDDYQNIQLGVCCDCWQYCNQNANEMAGGHK